MLLLYFHVLTQTFLCLESDQAFSFFKSVLPIFWVSPSLFFQSVVPFLGSKTFHFFWVSPSQFDSDLPVLFIKLLFNQSEFILQLPGLISSFLTWYVNRKYIFQWRRRFRGDINKLFLCRVYVHWNFRYF